MLLLAITSTRAVAQFGIGSLHGTSFGVSYNSAIGEFDAKVKSGFGLAIHTALGETSDTWTGRGSFGFDQFNGVGALNNIQFISYGFDLLHKSGSYFYQFAGLGLYSTSYNYKTTTDAGNAGTRNGTNFGVNGGMGVKMGSPDGVHAFLEVAATTLFTGSYRSSWVPVRLGLQF